MKRSPRNPAKLTQAQVIMIREKDSQGEFTHPCSYWSRIMMVNGETIRRARTGETWNWLDRGLQIEKEEVKEIKSDVSDEEIARSIAKFKKLMEQEQPAQEVNRYGARITLDKKDGEESNGIVGQSEKEK